MIKEEAEHLNRNNKDFNPVYDVFQQIPFFSCKNKFLDKKFQKDVTKYMYCNDTNTPPYSGSYGDVPYLWKEKHFLIKRSLSILQHQQRQEIIDKNKAKNGSR